MRSLADNAATPPGAGAAASSDGIAGSAALPEVIPGVLPGVLPGVRPGAPRAGVNAGGATATVFVIGG